MAVDVVLVYLLADWLAVVTSAVLLVALWRIGELSPAHGAVLVPLFLAGVYLQFFAAATFAVVGARALLMLLAVYLVVRWKFAT